MGTHAMFTYLFIFPLLILLPRDATQSAVTPQYVVCPSVRLSVMFRYHAHIGSWNTSKNFTAE